MHTEVRNSGGKTFLCPTKNYTKFTSFTMTNLKKHWATELSAANSKPLVVCIGN